MPARKILKGPARQRCAICGKAGELVRTECCGKLICGPVYNEKHDYWKESKCMRGHSRYTICDHHHTEGHSGDWKTCQLCRADFEPEMYAWYATNNHNTDPLENPPSFEPTYCAGCDKVIRLAYEPNMQSPDGNYYCAACMYDYLRKERGDV